MSHHHSSNKDRPRSISEMSPEEYEAHIINIRRRARERRERLTAERRAAGITPEQDRADAEELRKRWLEALRGSSWLFAQQMAIGESGEDD